MEKRRSVKKVKRRNSRKMGLKIIIAVVCIAAIGWGISEFYFHENPIEVAGIKTLKDNINNSKQYAISTSNEHASEAGAEILEQGGNAVDAAVAIAYSLSVVEPYGSGIGGGGSMVIYDPDTETYSFYNYGSEAAVSGNSSQILVPGFVSGMEAVRSDFGTMEFDELLAPAIAYCDGFQINESFEARIERASEDLGTDSIFYKDGKWMVAGDTLKQPELKHTLQTLADEGAESFYSGTIANLLTEETDLTSEDLAAYKTIKDDPVIGTYGDYEIASAAAPFSGTTLIQMLKITEALNIENPEKDRDAFLEKLETATLASHADRMSHVYDLRFSEDAVQEEKYVTDSYINQLLNLDTQNVEIEEESEDTTAFTVIDQNGMVVACTNTLSKFFGTRKSVGGFYLNNSGANFGSGVNARAPGKRPRTHIAPTILRDKDEMIAIASPGGSEIVKILAEEIIDTCCFETDVQQAVDKRRLLFEGNGVIYYETEYDTDLLAEVQGSGYRAIPVSEHSFFGNVALSGYRKGEGFFAAKDIRRNGDCKISNK